MPSKLYIYAPGGPTPAPASPPPESPGDLKNRNVLVEIDLPRTHDTGEKHVKVKFAGTTAVIDAAGVTVAVPQGHIWSIEKTGNGLTDDGNDPLGSLSLDDDEIRVLTAVLQTSSDGGMAPQWPHEANLQPMETAKFQRLADGLLKQLSRMAEAMRVKGVPDVDDLKDAKNQRKKGRHDG